MKLWRISQTANDNYDTFDSAVVAAKTEDEARLIHPGGYGKGYEGCWAKPEKVSVEYIGEARTGMEAGVIVASFNAG